MSQLAQLLTNNVGIVAGAVSVLGLGGLAINYRRKRRQMLRQERMATLGKRLHYSVVAREIISKPAADARDHKRRGWRWLFGAAALSAALYAFTSMQLSADPTNSARVALAGVVPGSIGLAHLLFSAMSRRRQRRELLSAASRNRLSPGFFWAMSKSRQRPNLARRLYR